MQDQSQPVLEGQTSESWSELERIGREPVSANPQPFAAPIKAMARAESEDIPLPPLEEALDPNPADELDRTDSKNRLWGEVRSSLIRHRMEGHATYHPSCPACVGAKGVFRHSRKDKAVRSMEVQADFCFVGGVKMLVLAELGSGALGFVKADAESRELVQNEIRAWARSVGVAGPSSTVISVRVDAEPALTSLLEGVLPCKLEKSAPQSPESTGGAERAARVLKESLACLETDLSDSGFRLKVNSETLPYLGRYVATMYNQHHRVFGGVRTPAQHVTGQDRQPLKSTMFGAVCFAEVPDSVDVRSRFVPASFLGYEYGSRAPVVCCKLDGEEVKVFRAKSIKVLTKVVFAVDLCPFLLDTVEESGKDRQSSFDPLEDKYENPIPMPKTGPPKAWLEKYGRTPNCYACGRVSLHGRVHSAACKARYRTWLEQERQNQSEAHSSEIPEPSGIRGHDGPPSALSEHPTGGRRATQKSPPVVSTGPPVADAEGRASVPFEPPEFDPSGIDEDMEYTPSEGPSLADDPMEIDEDSIARNFGSVESFVASRFAEEPVEDLLKIGALGLFDRKANILSPMYLPKIGEKTNYAAYKLGGRTVFLARPEKVVSEDRKAVLDVDKTVGARITELSSMEKVEFGTVIGKVEADKFCKQHDLKPIGCRWVITEKEINGAPDVRCRMVVQQIASGHGVAATLGYSSSTPSSEAVRAVLIQTASEGWHLGTLDVSTAFMNSDLPPGMRVVVRLPGDISLSPQSHQPAFAVLKRALNGLRCASKAWLMLAKSICESHGLSSCPGEPCVFRGKFQRKSFSCKMALVIYVDDILVGFDRSGALEELRDAFQEKVQKVKICGEIRQKAEGSVTFLGRTIARRKDNDSLFIRIPPQYLQELCEPLTSTTIPPDLEQLHKKCSEQDEQPLSNEAASEYRTMLGKIAWWAQSRVDILRFISILSTGQAQPQHKHEVGTKKLLRFLKSSLHLWQEFRKDDGSGVQLYCDASWKDTSISGYCILWRGNLLKAVSRVQQCISLSACEAELVACAQGCQETLGALQMIGFLEGITDKNVTTIRELLDKDVEELPKGMFRIFTDSASGLGFLKSDGFSRRARHLSIAFNFIQRLLYHGVLEIVWVSTKVQIADLFTKITDQNTTVELRKLLGFVEIDRPEEWQSTQNKPGKKSSHVVASLSAEVTLSVFDRRLELEALLKQHVSVVALLEICTDRNSGFSNCHLRTFFKKKFFVLQVTENDDILKCGLKLKSELERLQSLFSFTLYVWASPPCTGGSPAQHLCPGTEERVAEKFATFRRIIRACIPLFQIADHISLELSRWCMFWKSHLVRSLLKEFNLCSTSMFHRCSYDNDTSDSELKPNHTYRVQTTWGLTSKRTCVCQKHMPFGQQNLTSLGAYPSSMTEEICQSVGEHLKSRASVKF